MFRKKDVNEKDLRQCLFSQYMSFILCYYITLYYITFILLVLYICDYTM